MVTRDVHLRELRANFPSRVFAFVSVTNDHGFVPGLAHPSKWLGPQDLAENGLPVASIWGEAFEYPDGDRRRVGRFNLFRQRPLPRVTQISRTDSIPTATMLLMDVSRSIDGIPGALDSAKIGLQRFISQMRSPIDRAGILRFACDVDTLPLTNDLQELAAFVDSTGETHPWTPLFYAMQVAVEMLKDEPALVRSIVVYTDGKNSLPPNLADCPDLEIEKTNKPAPGKVIAAARRHNIAIHTIALDNAEQSVLQEIARETGGRFFKVEDNADFRTIYENVATITQSGYVMAYTSPEVCGADSARVVDLTVTLEGESARATAAYTYSGPLLSTDLTLRLTADRSEVRPGGQVMYRVAVTNLTERSAFDVRVEVTLADYLEVDPEQFSPPPVKADSTGLVWRLDSVSGGASAEIRFAARVSETVPDTLAAFLTTAEVSHDCEIAQANNLATARVALAPPRCELHLTKTAAQDTALAGDELTYTLRLVNQGQDAAEDVVLTDTLAAFLRPLNWPGTQDGNVLTLTFDTLPGGADTSVTYAVRLDTSALAAPFAFANRAGVASGCDVDSSNNVAQATVVVRPRPPVCDVSLTKTASADSVDPGQSFSYTLRVANVGPTPAFNLTLADTLPAALTVLNWPGFRVGNVLFFTLDTLAAGQEVALSLQVRADSASLDAELRLVNTASVAAACDTDSSNNRAQATVVVRKRTPVCQLTLSKSVAPDTVEAGSTLTYRLSVTNSGPDPAADVVLVDSLSEGLTALNWPGERLGNVLRLALPVLAPEETFAFEFEAQVDSFYSERTRVFGNWSWLETACDSAAATRVVSAAAVVRGLSRPPVRCDLALGQEVNADTARADQVLRYSIRLRNFGQHTAPNVVLIDTLSEFATPFEFDPSPSSVSDNLLFWRFDSLVAGQEVVVAFSARVNRNVPGTVPEIVNRVGVDSDCDLSEASTAFVRLGVPLLHPPPPVESCDAFVLDRNVFEPERQAPLTIEFVLETAERVRLEVLDIAGDRVTRLADELFQVGTNQVAWNGTDNNGQRVGSGVYIITLRTARLACWKKVIVAR